MELNAGARLRLKAAPNSKELLPKLAAKILEKRETVNSLESQKGNPTVAPSYHQAKGALEALEAVREALKGKMLNLNIL